MLAVTVEIGVADSVRVEDVPHPVTGEGQVLAKTLAVGVCGTDLELIAGRYGWAPKGSSRLILGHESLAQVEEAPPGCGLAAGDLIAGIVRRPDPVPCANCAVGEWDMCTNGRYTEHGIKELNGFCVERFCIEPQFAVRVDRALGRCGVLLEPTSVVAKAWEHVERIGQRAKWTPRRALVTGAGPIGLLAALLGKQRGLEVHVLDRVSGGPKPALVRDLGAQYHNEGIAALGFAPDIVIECTGAAAVIVDAVNHTAAGSVVCLAGVSSGHHVVSLDVGDLGRSLVLENDVIFGSVNANRRHYEAAAQALAQASSSWLERIITRRVPLSRWREAYERRAEDVKVVIDLALPTTPI